MRQKTNGAITWLQVNNLIPIVTSFIIMALSWSSLSSKIDLLNQKVDFLVQAQKDLVESRRGIETRYGELSLKVKELETIIKK